MNHKKPDGDTWPRNARVEGILGELASSPSARSDWPSGSDLRARAVRRRRRRQTGLGGGVLVSLALVATLAVTFLPSGSRGGNQLAAPTAVVRFVAVSYGGEQVIATLPRRTVTTTNRAAERLITSDEVTFAARLSRDMSAAAGSRNSLISPLSADIALSMLELGARGGTASGIASALQSASLSAAKQGEGWAGALAALSSANGPVQMSLANSVWMQRGVVFRSQFLKALAADFGQDAYEVDFGRSLAVQAINAWVSRETADRINELFAPSSLPQSTILVLANALHFKAAWAPQVQFQPTKQASKFVDASGVTVHVPMISTDSAQAAVSGVVTSRFEAAAIPYVGNRYSAIVIEPEKETLRQFVATLDGSELDQIVSSAENSPLRVNLTMPTFTLSTNENLNHLLSSMGMSQAFGPTADLSGISPSATRVSVVEQADRLVVDQWGTDAAAATAVAVLQSGTRSRVSIRVDHPYLFLIRDDLTGAILMTATIESL
jgi:serine protease inhibitor